MSARAHVVTPWHHRRMTGPPDTDSSAEPSSARNRRMDPQTNRGRRLALVQPRSSELQSGVLAQPPAAGGWMVRPADRSTRSTSVAGSVRHRAWSSLHTGRLDEEQRHWIGVLHAGDGAVLSHLTAARASRVALDGLRRHRRADAQGRPGPAARRLLLPPDAPAVRAVGQAGQRTAAAADRARRAPGGRAGPQRTPSHRRCWPPASSRAHHGRPLRIDHPAHPQAATRQDVRRSCSATSPAERSRSPRSTSGSLCAETDWRARPQVVRLDKEGRRRYLDCVWVLADGRVVVLEVDGSFHAEVRSLVEGHEARAGRRGPGRHRAALLDHGAAAGAERRDRRPPRDRRTVTETDSSTRRERRKPA